MKKFFVIAIAVVAISFGSCGSKTEKAVKEVSAACACDSCQCDSCQCTGQVDSTAVEAAETAKEEGVLESVIGAINKAQTKAKGKAGRGNCRHPGCGCMAYKMAWDGSGGKCVCGHWDYIHN